MSVFGEIQPGFFEAKHMQLSNRTLLGLNEDKCGRG